MGALVLTIASALGAADERLTAALAAIALITCLADSFGWHIPQHAGFDASAKSLLDHGYLMPLRGKPVG